MEDKKRFPRRHDNVLVTVQDIAERERMEADLQASVASMRAILDNSPYLVWLKDPEGFYITSNRAHANYVRLKDPWQIVGKTDFDLWPKELAEKYRADDAEVMASRQQKRVEEPSFDGEKIHWVETFKTPVIDKHGNVLGTTGFARDITERKQAEEMLRFHSEILLNLPEGISLIQATDGVIVFTNPQFEHMFGYEPGELLGKHVSIVNAPSENSPESMVSAMMNELARTGVWSGEMQTIRKDGTTFWCHASVSTFEHPQFGKVWASMHEDITRRRNVEDELKQTKERYDFATAVGKVGTWDWSPVTGNLNWSDETFRLMGFTPGAVTPSYELFLGLVHPEDREFVNSAVQAALQDMKPYVLDCRIVSCSGRQLVCQVVGKVEFDTNDQPIRMLGTIQDITQRKQAEEELRIGAIAFETQEGMMITDAHSVILRVNHAFTEITGYTAEEAVGQTARLLKSGRHDAAFYAAMWESIRRTGAWQGEIWNRRKNGEVYPEQLTITAVNGGNGEVTHYVATMNDITMRKQIEEQIRNLAFYDSLTQLPNRRLLNDRLEQAIAASKRSGRYGALMFLDLDNFKPLNDAHGHDAGDLLLVEVARRISSCVREVDTVARFGGDEFMVMLGELDVGKAESATLSATVAEKIRTALAEPYMLKLQAEGKAETTVEYHCTSSIGVALFINHQASTKEIIKWADMAMYQAKEAGGNLIRFYE